MDPRQRILADIDIDESKVLFSGSPIVLLCGGYVPEKPHPEAPDPEIASFRDAVTRQHPPYEIFRPEEIKSWQNDGVFKNLMDFESDLASICSLVVIILESAGAIAELGAFSQLQDLSRKLIVIVSDEFADAQSFINLGILRFIARDHDKGVKRYPWVVSRPKDIEPHVVSDAIDDIKVELAGLNKIQSFNVNSEVHLTVLIYELITIFVALKESELIEAIEKFGRVVRRDVIRRKIFLLEKFRLVEPIKYSDSTFFASKNDSFHKIRLALKGDGAIDPLRVRAECMAYYNETKSERNRIRAIQKAKLGAEK
ncbi:retron St85 family effector protein [Pseudomonas sp. TNT2022 ID233]|uniref:retron St85 family effector protein n=1 Tax=Pseudomonas aphyarum TaxID=2942629 RepID=UPI0023628427|nr:retron St85 family effector protein [Pseudomonas aphyarum]MDD1139240.1 retron St85 family effector protein [Pseudomonas aphyarum]